MTMAEPVSYPYRPESPVGSTDPLDVDSVVAGAVDLDAVPDVLAASAAGPVSSAGRHRRALPVAAEPEGATSILDHPATLVALSVLTLVAVVLGIDAASQGRWIALLPAVLLLVAYAAVVRRRRARR